MKFGLRYCNTGRYTDPARATELVQAAEAAGFESAWTVEHTVIPRGYQSAYPYTSDGCLPGGEGDFLLPDPRNVREPRSPHRRIHRRDARALVG
jgi:hypothetical protein